MSLHYFESFENLSTKLYPTKKPHKPALLLAIIDGIETGLIQKNRISITPELIAAFRKYWSVLTQTTYSSRSFAYPFYHLTGDGFWRLVYKPSKTIVPNAAGSISGLRQLQDAVDYARFNIGPWDLLNSLEQRNKLKGQLLPNEPE